MFKGVKKGKMKESGGATEDEFESSNFKWDFDAKNIEVFKTKGGLQVYVYEASIIKLPVDCIVNAANDTLTFGGGISKVIARAAGRSLDTECSAHIRKYGKVQVGKNIVTTAGDLPYRCVIHTVGPRWADYYPHTLDKVKACEQDLYDAVYGSLVAAERNGLKTIALPAISSAIFGVPERLCVYLYAMASLDYSKNSAGNASCLSEVHFIDINADIVKKIQEMFITMVRNEKDPHYDSMEFVARQSNSQNRNQRHSGQGNIQHPQHQHSPDVPWRDDKHRFQGNLHVHNEDLFSLKIKHKNAVVMFVDSNLLPHDDVAKKLVAAVRWKDTHKYLQDRDAKSKNYRSIFVTNGYGCGFDDIIHVVSQGFQITKNNQKRKTQVMNIYSNILDLALRIKPLAAIVLTLIKTGDGPDDTKLSTESLKNCYDDRMINIAERNLEVHIVCNDDKVHVVFNTLGMKPTEPSSPRPEHNRPVTPEVGGYPSTSELGKEMPKSQYNTNMAATLPFFSMPQQANTVYQRSLYGNGPIFYNNNQTEGHPQHHVEQEVNRQTNPRKRMIKIVDPNTGDDVTHELFQNKMLQEGFQDLGSCCPEGGSKVDVSLCSNEMAVPGRKGDKDLGIGSQDSFEINCDNCHEVKGVFSKPEGFCNICNEYMCKSCLEAHGLRRKTRNHEILSGDDMPRSRPPEPVDEKDDFNPAKECTARCEKHSDQVIRYYCKHHRRIGCTDCITLEHTGCVPQVALIADISSKESTEQEFQGFSEKLDQLSTLFTDLSRKAENNVQSSETQYKKAANDASEFNEQMMNKLHSLQNVVEENALEIKSYDCDKMKGLLHQSKSLLEETKQIETEFESLKKCGRQAQQFTLMKRMNSRLEELEKLGIEIEDDNFISDYRFLPDAKIKDILTCTTQLGNLTTGSNIGLIDSEESSLSHILASQMDDPFLSSRETQLDPDCNQESNQAAVTNPCYQDRILIKKEDLLNYLKTELGAVPEKMQYGTEGDILVKFKHNIDRAKVTPVKGKPLKKSMLLVSQVPISNCIHVSYLKETTSQETVQFYFENQRRSGEGEVDKVILNREEGSALVYFKDYKNVEKVLERNHVIDGQNVVVQRYLDCLGCPEGDGEEPPFKVPNPITVYNVDKQKIKFFNNSNTNKEALEKLMSHEHAKIIWPREKEANNIILECSLTSEVQQCRKLAIGWKQKAEKSFHDFFSQIMVITLNVTQATWDDVMKRLDSVSIDNPDAVAVFIDKENSAIVVAGLGPVTKKLGQDIKGFIKEVEDEVEKQKSIVKESITNMKLIDTKMLLAAKFPTRAEDNFKNLKVRINQNKHEITFEGPHSEVCDAKVFMYEMKDSFGSVTMDGIQIASASLYNTKQVKEYIVKKLKQSHCTAVWEVNEGKLTVCSTSDDRLHACAELIRDSVIEKSIGLQREAQCLVESSDWQNKLEEWNGMYSGKVKIVVANSKVVISGTDDVAADAVTAVKQYISRNTIIEQRVTFSTNIIKLIRKHHRSELDSISSKLLNFHVQITTTEGSDNFLVKGTKDGLTKAVAELNRLIIKVKLSAFNYLQA